MSEEKKEQEESSGLSERLLASRVLVISGGVDAKLASRVIQQMILLDQDHAEKPITMMINSPGGEVHSGFAIYDTARFLSAPVLTVVMGLAASMGSILALASPKGSRYSLPNAKFLIHQPLLMGYQGRATDLEIQAREILRDRDRIIQLYAAETGRTPEVIAKDIDLDKWMTAEEALEYGLIDKIIVHRSEIPQK